ncbi:hypothetical protein [Sphingomonas sp. M1-B02]|uniref:hypothetical protein n=1 Tax=Sphingomonas sp. M1-B02 TaxID=3114300 RepID=UPI00223EC685|nr:hypothetical protein [Sphingomonas sp. S6-11]UZK65140.1 hypothetical protein OKW87_11505 [Sphingomonas sp. S6-11]
MTDPIETADTPQRKRKLGLILAAAALIGVGGAGGAYAVSHSRPSVAMAPATPTAIRALADDDSLVTVRGKVVEEYGNRFILADGSGRALVDAGREGEDSSLVAPGQTVTVQGRFDRGSIRAAFLVKPDGKVMALGPLGGPHRRGGEGPGRGREGHRDGPSALPEAAVPAPPAEGVTNAS